jgi:hypothetical protein
VRVSAVVPTQEGSIEIDFNSGCVRVRGVVDAGMLRGTLAATRWSRGRKAFDSRMR